VGWTLSNLLAGLPHNKSLKLLPADLAGSSDDPGDVN
jgi:hypothetical protein